MGAGDVTAIGRAGCRQVLVQVKPLPADNPGAHLCCHLGAWMPALGVEEDVALCLADLLRADSAYTRVVKLDPICAQPSICDIMPAYAAIKQDVLEKEPR